MSVFYIEDKRAIEIGTKGEELETANTVNSVQEFCCKRIQRNGVVAGGRSMRGQEGCFVLFSRLAVWQHMFTNENFPVERKTEWWWQVWKGSLL